MLVSDPFSSDGAVQAAQRVLQGVVRRINELPPAVLVLTGQGLVGAHFDLHPQQRAAPCGRRGLIPHGGVYPCDIAAAQR